MNIQLNDKWWLTSTDRCFVLNKMHVIKSGERAGETTLSPVAYYSSLETLFQRLFELSLYTSDATTIEQLAEDFIKTKKFIQTVSEKAYDLALGERERRLGELEDEIREKQRWLSETPLNAPEEENGQTLANVQSKSKGKLRLSLSNYQNSV